MLLGFSGRRRSKIFVQNCPNYEKKIQKLILHTTLLIAHMPSNIFKQISAFKQTEADPQAVYTPLRQIFVLGCSLII